MDFTITEAAVSTYVKELYARFIRPSLVYHTLTHTESVVAYTKEISHYYQLQPEEQFILSSAAWFHDTGHLFVGMKLHEEASVGIMETFLSDKVNPSIIEEIATCILATKYPPVPGYLREAIICDADTYHFGTPDFWQTDQQMKTEMQLRTHQVPANWDQETLTLLKEHRFFTSYCQSRLMEGKQQNIQLLEKKLSNH